MEKKQTPPRKTPLYFVGREIATVNPPKIKLPYRSNIDRVIKRNLTLMNNTIFRVGQAHVSYQGTFFNYFALFQEDPDPVIVQMSSIQGKAVYDIRSRTFEARGFSLSSVVEDGQTYVCGIADHIAIWNPKDHDAYLGPINGILDEYGSSIDELAEGVVFEQEDPKPIVHLRKDRPSVARKSPVDDSRDVRTPARDFHQ